MRDDNLCHKANSTARAYVSVVMPCFNEASTIGACVDKAVAGLAKASVDGEIIVVDNGSTDDSAIIAASRGARVIHEPSRGYGNALLRGFDEARGSVIIMGDSDSTYDFSEINKFIKEIEAGADMVIGSRFKGKILPGAMPWFHQYVGNPVLTGILNILFRAGVSDAHSGMRAFTPGAYQEMRLVSTGMELASEMVINAARAGLRIAEVPIAYYPRGGRSKLRSFHDGWRHLRFMLVRSPTYLYTLPGLLTMLFGMGLLLMLLPGPVVVGAYYLDFHFMIVASFLSILGIQILSFGVGAKVLAAAQGLEPPDRLVAALSGSRVLEMGIMAGVAVLLAGLFVSVDIVAIWISSGFRNIFEVRRGLLGLTLDIMGVQIVFVSFFLSTLQISTRRRRS